MKTWEIMRAVSLEQCASELAWELTETIMRKDKRYGDFLDAEIPPEEVEAEFARHRKLSMAMKKLAMDQVKNGPSN